MSNYAHGETHGGKSVWESGAPRRRFAHRWNARSLSVRGGTAVPHARSTHLKSLDLRLRRAKPTRGVHPPNPSPALGRGENAHDE